MPTADDPDLRAHPEDVAQANHLLSVAHELVASRQPTAIRDAISFSEKVIEAAEKFEAEDKSAAGRLLSAAWLLKANALRETHDPSLRPQSLEAYASAVRHFETVAVPDDPEDTNHFANLWTNRGMALLDDGSPSALVGALPCFERAIDLRKDLPLDRNPLYVWGLSAAWMNAADTLTRLGQPDQVTRALSCYDHAIALLQRMPLDEHPTYRARLALAWMNRGLTLTTRETADATQEAERCFAQSIGQFGTDQAPAHPEQRRILSCAHLNHGHSLLNQRPAKPAPARDDAFSALRLAQEFEQNEVLAAQIGLQSRHLLCRAIAFLVDEGNVPEDWIAETTDAVDDGMALARHWRQLGESLLQPIEAELFRYGALIYRLCQPHFLAEFLLDCMDPAISPGAPVAVEAMHHIATDALWSVIMDVNAQQQADPSPANQARLFERLTELQDAEKRLTELRLQHLAPKRID